MNYPYNNVCLDVVKFSLDKGDLTGYYIHNGKSLRLRTLFSNALNYDWFNQSIFISNPLLTRFLVIVHHSIIPITVKTVFRDEGVLVSTSPPPHRETVVLILLRVIGITSPDNSDKRFGYGDDFPLMLG